jgi:redox-sensitive bicupin YhaK (pirin superfamily)
MFDANDSKLRFSRVVRGHDVILDDCYRARRFDRNHLGSDMAPLRSIEHFVQTERDAHSFLLAGVSVLTLVLEDSTGEFLCYDAEGEPSRVKPGDAHWFIAGHGGVCRYDLAPGTRRVHGLRMLIDSPPGLKGIEPLALNLPNECFKHSSRPPVRVKMVDLEQMAPCAVRDEPQALSISDVALSPRTRQSFATHAGRNTVLVVVAGVMRVVDAASPSNYVDLKFGEAVAFASPVAAPYSWRIHAPDGARVFIVAGQPVGERNASSQTDAVPADNVASEVGG